MKTERRPFLKTSDKLGLVVILGGVIGIGAYTHFSNELEADASKAAGFSAVNDFRDAKAAGYSDPGKWAAERQRRQKEQQKRDAEAYERSRNPATKMAVKSMTWSKGGFGTVALITVTVQNSNDFPVKDVSLACNFSAASGTELSNPSATIYETINSNSARTFKEFNVGFIHSQAQRGGCSVDSARRL